MKKKRWRAQTWEVWFALFLVLQQPQAGSVDEVELSVSAEMQLSLSPHALSSVLPQCHCQRSPVSYPAPARSLLVNQGGMASSLKSFQPKPFWDPLPFCERCLMLPGVLWGWIRGKAWEEWWCPSRPASRGEITKVCLSTFSNSDLCFQHGVPLFLVDAECFWCIQSVHEPAALLFRPWGETPGGFILTWVSPGCLGMGIHQEPGERLCERGAWSFASTLLPARLGTASWLFWYFVWTSELLLQALPLNSWIYFFVCSVA